MNPLNRLFRQERPRSGDPYDGPRARFADPERVSWPGVYAVDEAGEPVARLEWEPDPHDEGRGRWVYA